MIPFMRRQKILEILHMDEIVYIDDLVSVTGVSDATIRRDLKILHEEGKVDILSGGASKLRVNLGEKPLEERVNINKAQKDIVGTYAATLVNDGDFIFVGPGTTENTMIEHLADKGITVVTNGAFHINKLIENKIDSIIIGGRIVNEIAVLAGPNAIEQIKKMHFDKCFIGCSGMSTDGVLTTSDENVAAINSQVIKQTNEVYFIADSSKVSTESRFQFAKMEKDYLLITDKEQKDFDDSINYIVVE